MKVVVLGANGMAGHIISAYLKEQNYYVLEVTRDLLDVESQMSRLEFFTELDNPDYIVNCIGVLGPDSNKSSCRTILVNSWFPHFLEEIYKNTDTKIIHISTDCVFDGKRGYYIESDLPNETNIYGRSKALGEINNDKDITLRMSIIGTEIKDKNRRSGLLNWVINNKEVILQGWETAIWNGITTLELAKQINNYIKNPWISGIYHLVPDYTISKYHLVSHINEIFNCNKKVIPVPGKGENKSLIDTRNEYKIFRSIPTYREQLMELKEFNEKILT